MTDAVSCHTGIRVDDESPHSEDHRTNDGDGAHGDVDNSLEKMFSDIKSKKKQKVGED